MQLLCKRDGVPDILGVDHRIEVMGVAKKSMIKDLENPIFSKRYHVPQKVIPVPFEGPSIPGSRMTDRVKMLM